MPFKDANIPDYIPRMTVQERLDSNPTADGFLAWQTDGEKGYYYHSNSKWYKLLAVQASAGGTRPDSPYTGQVFVDFTLNPKGILIAWNGSDWINVTGALV